MITITTTVAYWDYDNDPFSVVCKIEPFQIAANAANLGSQTELVGIAEYIVKKIEGMRFLREEQKKNDN